ncbi:hypothetical protein ACPA9J_09640 [Pseudomonas aeruginosa]
MISAPPTATWRRWWRPAASATDSLLPPRRRPLRTAAATRTQRPAGADPAHPRRGNRALRRTHRTRRGSPGMPARLSLAGQCPPVAACVALRLRAVRRRHPATRRPSGRAAWRRPDTGQCVRERRRSGARRPARRPRAASLETPWPRRGSWVSRERPCIGGCAASASACRARRTTEVRRPAQSSSAENQNQP